jgi:hypothetical protein
MSLMLVRWPLLGSGDIRIPGIEAHACIPGLRNETWGTRTRQAHHVGKLLRGQAGDRHSPQGLKPGFNLRRCGTTEVVPCYKTVPSRNLLLPPPHPAFGFHQVQQNIVDAGEVDFALGAEPFEHLRVEAHAHWNLSMHGAQAHHRGKLVPGSGGGSTFPQGLKPGFYLRHCGTTEVVPCYKTRAQSGLELPSIFLRCSKNQATEDSRTGTRAT